MKTYSELIKIPDFVDRVEYLQIKGKVGYETFGGHRYLNQRLYQDPFWKKIRREVIQRDSDGDFMLDLAHPDRPFDGRVYIHHIEPITIDDILNRRSKVFDMENLICTSFKTHEFIHYGIDATIFKDPITRTKDDTCLWR